MALDSEGVTRPETEVLQAACLSGPAVHAEVAARLVPALLAGLDTQKGAA